MRIKRTVMVALTILGIVAFWSVQVGAYGVFSADPIESGNCSQCHLDWPGATHTVHQGFDCAACHDNDPVLTSSCSACHPAAGLLDLHSPLLAPGDGNYCGNCHAGVDNVQSTFGEFKALFK